LSAVEINPEMATIPETQRSFIMRQQRTQRMSRLRL